MKTLTLKHEDYELLLTISLNGNPYICTATSDHLIGTPLTWADIKQIADWYEANKPKVTKDLYVVKSWADCYLSMGPNPHEDDEPTYEWVDELGDAAFFQSKKAAQKLAKSTDSKVYRVKK